MKDHHPPTPDPLAFWLEAELTGRDTDAEAALEQVFRNLPLPVPRPGFADRVLRAVIVPSLLTVPSPRAVWVFPPWLRAAVVACLALAGLALATLPTVGVAFGRVVRPAEVLTAAAGRLVAALDWIAGGIATLEALHGVQEALLQVLGAPPVLAVLLVALLISMFGFRGLVELLTPERSLDHASTNG